MPKIKPQYDKHPLFMDKLKTLYSGMDQKYNDAAEYYGFHCNGCKDNCCLTRFYHHTLLEYYYLLSGYNVLDSEMKIKVKNIALEVCRKTEEADKRGTGIRIMCPLNFDGLCVLYDHRPMICRLHGIPHELQKPGHQVYYGPGCESFTEQAGSKKYYKFDRTPFYINMAQLENELRHETGINRKLKMTVAQMLIESL